MTDDDVTIWFNQSCSKCESALEVLHGRGIDPNVVEYLEQPPTADEIRDVLGKLGLGPRDLVRKSEPLYAELGLDDAADDELIDAMAANPILIERPVVVKGSRAVIGRPPERVVDVL